MSCYILWFKAHYGFVLALFLLCLPNQSIRAQAVIEWEPLNNNLEGATIEILWQSPDGVFFAGGSNSGLFRSRAFGAPWEPVNLGPHQALDFTSDPHGNLFIQTKDYIFESTDEGLSWSKAEMDFPLWPLLLHPIDWRMR